MVVATLLPRLAGSEVARPRPPHGERRAGTPAALSTSAPPTGPLAAKNVRRSNSTTQTFPCRMCSPYKLICVAS